jgi:transcriptional regulator with XRE-family HTH domain
MPVQDPIDQALAHTLRRLREERGQSQEDVAQSAGITLAALARIERGQTNPRWTTVRRILGALEITLTELGTTLDDAPA